MSDMKCNICGKNLKAEPNLTGPGWEIFHECSIPGATAEEAIKRYHEMNGLYTLADLEQARRQGAEDERGRCIEAVIDATHGGALRSAVDAIRALGPVGETREETEKRVRHETINKIHSETKLNERLTEQRGGYIDAFELLQVLDAIAEGKRDAQED